MTGRRGDDPEVGRAAANEAQASPWLTRWAGLVKLPPAQARTAALLVAAAAAGVALMGLPGLIALSPSRRELSRPAAAGPPPSWTVATTLNAPPPERPGYGEEVERELEAILGLMDGVGSVKVFVTWEQGPEQVVAFNETVEQRALPGSGPDAARSQAGSERRIQRQIAIVRESEGRRETPVVLTERYPVVKGVMVVADGARDPKVRLAIQRAVAAALGIAPYRIYVDVKRR